MKTIEITVRTQRKIEFIDITSSVLNVVRESEAKDGMVNIYCPHTTAAVTINENADPSVREDIQMFFKKIIPEHDAYRHLEGNSPAHIASTLVGISLNIPLINGRLVLGTWQGIYFCEFDGPRLRKCRITIY